MDRIQTHGLMRMRKRISNILKLINHPDITIMGDDGQIKNETLHNSIEEYAWWLIIATFSHTGKGSVKRYHGALGNLRKNFKTVVFIIGITPQFSFFSLLRL